MGTAHGRLAVVGDLVRPIGIYEVVAGTADDDLYACRIVERVHRFVAAATGDLVGGGDEAMAVVYQIVTVAAGDGVRAQRAGDLVFAGPAGDRVAAAATVHLILTRTAREAVVAPGSEESGVTREKVLALQPDDRVVSGPAREPSGPSVPTATAANATPLAAATIATITAKRRNGFLITAPLTLYPTCRMQGQDTSVTR